MKEKEREKHLPTYPGCLVCGNRETNPNTLNRRFRIADGGVETDFTAESRQEGYREIVHGGVLCALLDETIGWAVGVDRKCYFVTAELSVRFIRPLKVGARVTVRGRSLEHKSRYSTADGEIVGRNGTVYARATGKFVPMPPEQEKLVHDYLTFREGDVDFLQERQE